MKNKTVKTYIKKLLKEHGGRENLAIVLGITERYIRLLEKGDKIPSEPLRKLIKAISR